MYEGLRKVNGGFQKEQMVLRTSDYGNVKKVESCLQLLEHLHTDGGAPELRHCPTKIIGPERGLSVSLK